MHYSHSTAFLDPLLLVRGSSDRTPDDSSFARYRFPAMSLFAQHISGEKKIFSFFFLIALIWDSGTKTGRKERVKQAACEASFARELNLPFYAWQLLSRGSSRFSRQRAFFEKHDVLHSSCARVYLYSRLCIWQNPAKIIQIQKKILEFDKVFYEFSKNKIFFMEWGIYIKNWSNIT